MNARVYLDWNATAPLLPEARAAMESAHDMLGNPSSVHAEGRAARALIERARAQVAQAIGAAAGEIVFTSGATEAAALALAGRGWSGSAVEHECVGAWTDAECAVGADGGVMVTDPARTALQAANSETGVMQVLPQSLGLIDAVQAVGRIAFDFDRTQAAMAMISAHKFGGPRGIGALVLREGVEIAPRIRGGGQETGRRAGTENLAGIAGLGAAIETAERRRAAGEWEEVAEIRNILEKALEAAAPQTIFVGKASSRLPNTSCFALPGWTGETQVMQLDLAGYAISAGSACSSGKVRSSRVLRAMGYDHETSGSAVRVSIGPTTTEAEVMGFADAWVRACRRFEAKAA